MTAAETERTTTGAAQQAGASLPGGRYGREGRYPDDRDARADRKLKIAGGVSAFLFLAVLGWFGWHYVAGKDISGELIAFEVTTDRTVDVHLEVRKDQASSGYCTLRSRAENGAEVGRADFRFDEEKSRVDKLVTLRTTSRATSAELVGCWAG